MDSASPKNGLASDTRSLAPQRYFHLGTSPRFLNNTTKPVESKRKIRALKIPPRARTGNTHKYRRVCKLRMPSFPWVLRPLRREKITPGVILL